MFQVLVGIITMHPWPWELESNFAQLEAYVREAARRHAKVIVAPESVIDGYVYGADPDVTRERMLDVAQTVPDGPYIRRAAALAKELEVCLVFGFLERDGDELFNACIMLDSRGEIVGRYRKVHPTNEFAITPGRELQPFDTQLGKTGFLICNDASIAENFAALSAQQVDIIFIPTNGGPRTMVDFIQRAVDTAAWIVVANTASCGIVSPRGAVYLEKREAECVSVQRVDIFDSPRKDGLGSYAPPFTGRRPDLYRPVTQSTEPQVLFDMQGNATELEQQRRRSWLESLRGMMNR